MTDEAGFLAGFLPSASFAPQEPQNAASLLTGIPQFPQNLCPCVVHPITELSEFGAETFFQILDNLVHYTVNLLVGHGFFFVLKHYADGI